MVGSDYSKDWIRSYFMIFFNVSYVVMWRDSNEWSIFSLDTDLTDWIFARANELENPAPAPPQQQQQQTQQSPPKESVSSSTTETTNKPRGNRIFAQAIGGINGSTQSTRHSRSRSRSPEVRPRGRDRERSPYRKNIEDRLNDRNGRHQQQRLTNGRQVQILESNGTQRQNCTPNFSFISHSPPRPPSLLSYKVLKWFMGKKKKEIVMNIYMLTIFCLIIFKI